MGEVAIAGIPPLDLVLLGLLRAEAAGPPAPGVPWDALCARAEEQGAAPALYRRLHGREGVPGETLGRLRRNYLEAAAEATHRAPQLGRVLALLRDSGIAVIVLKGAYLAEAAYESPALRRMGDVDLLVPAADLARARDALLADGFRQRRFSPLAREVVGRHHLLPFVRDDARALTVELHAQLTPRHIAMLDADGVWERSRPARVAGVEARALCPEDLLVHLAVHACLQHRLAAGLAPLLDADAVLRAFAGRIDGDALVARARGEGAGESAALLLTLAGDLLGTPVPEGLAARLAPAGIAPEVRALACGQLFSAAGDLPFVPRTLARLLGARGVGEALGVLRGRLLTSRREREAGRGGGGPLPCARAALSRLVEVGGMLLVFRGSVLRALAGCADERRSAAAGLRGEALACALTRGGGDPRGQRSRVPRIMVGGGSGRDDG